MLNVLLSFSLISKFVYKCTCMIRCDNVCNACNSMPVDGNHNNIVQLLGTLDSITS